MKRPLLAIHRTSGVGGVGAIVVSAAGREVGEVADEGACAAAIGGMETGGSGARSSAIADTAGDDGIAAIGGHLAAADGA